MDEKIADDPSLFTSLLKKGTWDCSVFCLLDSPQLFRTYLHLHPSLSFPYISTMPEPKSSPTKACSQRSWCRRSFPRTVRRATPNCWWRARLVTTELSICGFPLRPRLRDVRCGRQADEEQSLGALPCPRSLRCFWSVTYQVGDMKALSKDPHVGLGSPAVIAPQASGMREGTLGGFIKDVFLRSPRRGLRFSEHVPEKDRAASRRQRR
ncbi:uncharacterized protein IWZ02DRAFT_77006 [Phyllosticta citriasiana]|uniref:uncharacterized protein n=1 Tax=Phyllosticta citriasiana TaxID=595635 RepID=UPI0030FD563D